MLRIIEWIIKRGFIRKHRNDIQHDFKYRTDTANNTNSTVAFHEEANITKLKDDEDQIRKTHASSIDVYFCVLYN